MALLLGMFLSTEPAGTTFPRTKSLSHRLRTRATKIRKRGRNCRTLKRTRSRASTTVLKPVSPGTIACSGCTKTESASWAKISGWEKRTKEAAIRGPVDGYTTEFKECGMTLPIARSTGTIETAASFLLSCSTFKPTTIYQVLEKWIFLRLTTEDTLPGSWRGIAGFDMTFWRMH